MARYGHNSYKIEYDDLIVEIFSKGKSLADFCVEVKCGRRTVFEWIDRYPNFAKQYDYARECAKAFRDNFAQENMWISYGEEGTNFDVKSYISLTKSRFIDMNRESPNVKLFNKKKNPDLFDAMQRLADATAKEEISIEQSKAIAAIIHAASGIKEKELMSIKLDEIERMLKDGTYSNNTTVKSPDAECEVIEEVNDSNP